MDVSTPIKWTGKPMPHEACQRQFGNGASQPQCLTAVQIKTSQVAGCLQISFRLEEEIWKEGASFNGMLLEHPCWTHCLPLFGCDFSFGSWDSQALELCGFALFYFGVGESMRGGEREGAGL